MDRPTWGDTVRIKSSAPPVMQRARLAAVCGIRKVESVVQAKLFDCEIGTTLLLLEFGDGHSIEIPEEFVEVANE